MNGDMLVDALEPGHVLLHGQYRIDSFLNSGGFGITYLALDSLDRKVVIKECFPNAMCCRSADTVRARSESMQTEFRTVVKNFLQEARRVAKLNHPNIVGVHQVFEDNGTAYMALDFVEGRDLMDVIENDRDRFTPPQIRAIFMKALAAVAYIHDRDVLHRDISPDNILLDTRNEPVLIDFGAARDVAKQASRVLSALHVVKDGYSPQEFYFDRAAQTTSSDLYSLGATFYHLISGEAPPNAQVRIAALASQNMDPYQPLEGNAPGYDRDFLAALDKAMATFPKDRPQTAAEWIEAVDAEKRQQSALNQARQDKTMAVSIRQLTAETNKALEAEIKEGKLPEKTGHQSRFEGRGSELMTSVGDRPTGKTRPLEIISTDDDMVLAPVDPSGTNSGGTEDVAGAKTAGKPRRKSVIGRILMAPVWLVAGRNRQVGREYQKG